MTILPNQETPSSSYCASDDRAVGNRSREGIATFPAPSEGRTERSPPISPLAFAEAPSVPRSCVGNLRTHRGRSPVTRGADMARDYYNVSEAAKVLGISVDT